MAQQISAEIVGLDELLRAFKKSPMIVKKYVSRAVKASIFEIQKRDTDTNLQFKTPRAQRTGRLQQSIRSNVVIRGMYGSIGPDTEYASRVHKKNKYMPRILEKAQISIDKQFEDALDKIADSLTP